VTLPREIFANGMLVDDGVVWTSSNSGFWMLDQECRLVAFSKSSASSNPVKIGREIGWLREDGTLSALGQIKPFKLPESGITVVTNRDGVYSANGTVWHGPIAAIEHSFAVDRDADGTWWAFKEASTANSAISYELARSTDLKRWEVDQRFDSDQPGALAVGNLTIIIGQRSGLKRIMIKDRTIEDIRLGLIDERPTVSFDAGFFWALGERGGLWQSVDGRHWNEVRLPSSISASDLIQFAISDDVAAFGTIQGKIIRIRLAELKWGK
jgi:hypothetical protein